MPTELDASIEAALSKLSGGNAPPFDYPAYIRAFRESAREKARTVLDELSKPDSPFAARRPVFVSIGGGDGEELAALLGYPEASLGVLVEAMKPLADAARERNASSLGGKRIEVFEGDASDKLAEALAFARKEVKEDRADFLAVTCHAVIHELFDRSRDRFDPLAFFASIFDVDAASTWFTYREPGVPEKWTQTVILKAKCSPKSLERLATAIQQRHPSIASFRQLNTVGEGLRLDRAFAIELLAKLFYLEDLPHEIAERSSSVNHTILNNNILLSFGDLIETSRVLLRTNSSATGSFERHWREKGVSAKGLNPDNSQILLAMPESHCRVIAWKLSEGFAPSTTTIGAEVALSWSSEGAKMPDLKVAWEALEAGESEVAIALLVSRGRFWIETESRDSVLTLLANVCERYPEDSLGGLWSSYLMAISGLFEGEGPRSKDNFSPDREHLAQAVGLGQLYLAERMEFARKSSRADNAISTGNQLLASLKEGQRDRQGTLTDTARSAWSRLMGKGRTQKIIDRPDLDRYVRGTSLFLLGNLLRSGGRYDLAQDFIKESQKCFIPSIPSHRTELMHCMYARQVCAAMMGHSEVEIQTAPRGEITPRFALGLVHMSTSHAAWFVGEIDRAEKLATMAADEFRSIKAPRYVERASLLSGLLKVWRDHADKRPLNVLALPQAIAGAIETLTGLEDQLSPFLEWFSVQRPSTALGLLQFAKNGSRWLDPISLTLPRTIEKISDVSWRWRGPAKANSLQEADRILRENMNIPVNVAVPLLAD